MLQQFFFLQKNLRLSVFKSVNLKKICFTYNDYNVSRINMFDIIGKLPEPQPILKRC